MQFVFHHQHQYINGYLPAGIAHLDPRLSNMNRNHLSHPEQIQSSHQGQIDSSHIGQICISYPRKHVFFKLESQLEKYLVGGKEEKVLVFTCNPSCWPKTICLTMNLKVNGFSNCSQNTRFVDMNRSNKLYSINLTKSYKVLKI